jgi:hypothetical protein
MKVYIVFLGLLIVHVHFMVFNQDLGRYIMLQNLFKDTSEECAAQSALLLDEDEYYQGRIVFLKNGEDSERVLEQACQKLGLEDGYLLTLHYEDDNYLYDQNNPEMNPRVTARISVYVSSLFTSEMFEGLTINRTSCYEIL